MIYINPPYCKALSFEHSLGYEHDSPSLKKDYPKGPKFFLLRSVRFSEWCVNQTKKCLIKDQIRFNSYMNANIYSHYNS